MPGHTAERAASAPTETIPLPSGSGSVVCCWLGQPNMPGRQIYGGSSSSPPTSRSAVVPSNGGIAANCPTCVGASTCHTRRARQQHPRNHWFSHQLRWPRTPMPVVLLIPQLFSSPAALAAREPHSCRRSRQDTVRWGREPRCRLHVARCASPGQTKLACLVEPEVYTPVRWTEPATRSARAPALAQSGPVWPARAVAGAAEHVAFGQLPSNLKFRATVAILG